MGTDLLLKRMDSKEDSSLQSAEDADFEREAQAATQPPKKQSGGIFSALFGSGKEAEAPKAPTKAKMSSPPHI